MREEVGPAYEVYLKKAKDKYDSQTGEGIGKVKNKEKAIGKMTVGVMKTALVCGGASIPPRKVDGSGKACTSRIDFVAATRKFFRSLTDIQMILADNNITQANAKDIYQAKKREQKQNEDHEVEDEDEEAEGGGGEVGGEVGGEEEGEGGEEVGGEVGEEGRKGEGVEEKEEKEEEQEGWLDSKATTAMKKRASLVQLAPATSGKQSKQKQLPPEGQKQNKT